jgi:hypothetical protein
MSIGLARGVSTPAMIAILSILEKKMTDKEMCEYFKKVAADPSALAPPLTVREFLQLRQHILVCQECSDLVDKTLENAPPDRGPQVSEN